MKIRLLFGVMLLMAVGACSKSPRTAEAAPPPPPTNIPPPTPTPAPPPTPAPEPPAAPPATPEPNYFAPEGVYFLLTKITIETPDGLIGYPAGTKVVRTGDKYRAPDGKNIAVEPDQITNDLRIAERVAGLDTAIQASIRSVTSTQAAIAAATAATPPVAPSPGGRTYTYTTTTTGPDGTQTVRQTTTTHTVTSYPDAIAKQLQELDRQRVLADNELSRIHTAWIQLSNRDPRTSPAAEQLTRQRNAVEERLRIIREQRALVLAGR